MPLKFPSGESDKEHFSKTEEVILKGFNSRKQKILHAIAFRKNQKTENNLINFMKYPLGKSEMKISTGNPQFLKDAPIEE